MIYIINIKDRYIGGKVKMKGYEVTEAAEQFLSEVEKMTKKIKVILTCFKQTSYEDYTHFFKTVEIEVPYNKGEEWHVCGEEYQEPDEIKEN